MAICCDQRKAQEDWKQPQEKKQKYTILIAEVAFSGSAWERKNTETYLQDKNSINSVIYAI